MKPETAVPGKAGRTCRPLQRHPVTGKADAPLGVAAHRLSCPTGCGAAWLARLLWEQKVLGSSPSIPTKIATMTRGLYAPQLLPEREVHARLHRQVAAQRGTTAMTRGPGEQYILSCQCGELHVTSDTFAPRLDDGMSAEPRGAHRRLGGLQPAAATAVLVVPARFRWAGWRAAASWA